MKEKLGEGSHMIAMQDPEGVTYPHNTLNPVEPTGEEIRKTVRWTQFAMNATFDHHCDKLPEGVRFHKFKFALTTDDRRTFGRAKQLVMKAVCPYCGATCVYDVRNARE